MKSSSTTPTNHSKDDFLEAFGISKKDYEKVVKILSDYGTTKAKLSKIKKLKVEKAGSITLSLYLSALFDKFNSVALSDTVFQDIMATKKDGMGSAQLAVLGMFGATMMLGSEFKHGSDEQLLLVIYLLPILIATGAVPISVIVELLEKLDLVNSYGMEKILDGIQQIIKTLSVEYDDRPADRNKMH